MNSVEQFLREKLDEEILLYHNKIEDYPQQKYVQLLKRWSDESLFSEKHRFELYKLLFTNNKNLKILDMAAGCGSFVLQGLLNGYNTYGVEPSDWKHDLIDLKFKENNYLSSWRERIIKGYGESLPFENETFDVFDSWQTFEHVSNIEACFTELFRVLKKGGSGILNCPNYCSFFEGHYSMFWFPMLGNSWFAKLYLKLRNRPINGLETFHPVNKRIIKKHAKRAGFTTINLYKKLVLNSIMDKSMIFRKKMMYPLTHLIYIVLTLKSSISNFGKKERTVCLLFEKK